MIRQKLCRNCAFPQNFHTRKLGEITVFYAVNVRKKIEKTAEKEIENPLNKPTAEAKQILPTATTYYRILPNIKSVAEKTMALVTGQFEIQKNHSTILS